MKKINFPIVFNLTGILLLMNAVFMLFTVLVSLYHEEDIYKGLLLASLVTSCFGAFFYYFTNKAKKSVSKREGYLVVGIGWILMTLFGTLPYLFAQPFLPINDSNTITFTNAFFEVMSGYTTTGATILNDIESLPKGLLFWRSLTHWIGGMGIIVLTIAILPLLGIGGMQLFVAEAPGISADKLHPRITDTAKRLWLIYFVLTIVQTCLLFFAGMTFFDAINHALSTISTGGFSTKNASISFWNDQPIIQYIIMFFMFFAGTNFVLIYFLFKGKLKKIFRNEEFIAYASIIFFCAIITTAVVYLKANPTNSTITHFHNWIDDQGSLHYGLENSFRHSLFQVISVISTTGFVTADFSQWTPFITLLFFVLLFIGGSAGSTSGGIKIVRHLILTKNSWFELKRLLHPNAIIPVRYNGKAISPSIVYNILAFLMSYVLIFIFGSIVIAFLESSDIPTHNDVISALSITASSLGNVGPALGRFSPVDNYASLSIPGKWVISFLMLLGRLELFTILILLSPFFWRK